EMATLTAVEPVGTPQRLTGDVALAGLYLNELVVRLTGRQDPSPVLFDAYATTLARLAAGESPGWSLRRFERDLLEATGYGLQLLHEADSGEAIEPAAWYRYVVEQGAVPCIAGSPQALRGADLLALAQDRMPDNIGLKSLRDLMREVIRFQLGGGELRAWRVLAMAISRRPGTKDA
ncbi:MAG: DNA repair protein RecO C-terminal domain-containing protein, partial [Rhodanobacter sp.]